MDFQMIIQEFQKQLDTQKVYFQEQLNLQKQEKLELQKQFQEQLELQKLIAVEKQLEHLQKRQRDVSPSLVKQTKHFLVHEELITPVIQQADFSQLDKHHFYCIDGDIQSGKTKTTLSYMLLSVMYSLKTIVVVRNINDDSIQMMNAATKLLNRQSVYFKKMFQSNVQQSCCNVKDITNWAYNPNCNILVVMANTSQLGKLVSTLKGIETSFSLFIDEADQLLHTAPSKSEKNVSKYMKQLVEKSKCTYLVSATNYNNYFNAGIYVNHIIRVPVHIHYKGINALQFNTLDIATNNAPSIFDKSNQLLNVIDTLTHRELYPSHPTILLAKCSRLVSHQDEIVRFISNSKYSSTWSALSYNSEGVTIFSSNLIGQQEIVIDTVVGQPDDSYTQQGVFRFKGLGIMQALSFMKQLKNTRIIISSGMLAGRCINFMDDEYDWHITDEYIDPAITATIDSIIQSLRICGIQKNETPLTVWCTESVKKDILATYNHLTQYIYNLKDKESDVYEVLKKTVIHKSKVGAKKVCKQPKPYKVTGVAKNDNTSDYTSETNSSLSDEEPSGGEHDDVQLEKNGLIRVKKAYTNQTGIIYKIIKMYIDNDYKSMAKQELDTCGDKNTIYIKHYMKWNNHGQTNLLEKTKNDSYILRTQIIDYLNLL